MSLRGSTGAIRGWGCTPTGDAPATSTEEPCKTCLPPILTKGWRRNALYGILLFLMVLVFLNIALTLWIISALRLNMSGVGPLKIVKGGIQLDGEAWILNRLVSSTITPPTGQPLTMHSHRNFTVLVAHADHEGYSKFIMKRDSVEVSGGVFEVRDARGRGVFRASREEVRVYGEALVAEGAGGVVVHGALQAPLVRAPPAADLQLESLTRRLEVRAPQAVVLESRAGSVHVAAHGDVLLASTVGAIRFDASNLIISNLKEMPTTEQPQKNVRNKKVYQLCACASGKLFLASPDAPCAATDDDLCRS